MAEGHLGGERTLILKPMTFMNESSKAVGEAVRFLKIPLDRVVVFHDELDLAPGRIRMKKGGGAGGHNGLRDIDAHVGKDYRRVRIGIGHPGHKDLVLHWVLRDFEPDERDPKDGWLPKVLKRAGRRVGAAGRRRRQGRRTLHEPRGASRAAAKTSESKSLKA